MHGLLRPAKHFLAPASSAQSHFGLSPANALDANDFISAQPWFDLQLHRSHGRRGHQRSRRRPRRQVRRGKRSVSKLAPLSSWIARLTPRLPLLLTLRPCVGGGGVCCEIARGRARLASRGACLCQEARWRSECARLGLVPRRRGRPHRVSQDCLGQDSKGAYTRP